MLRPPMSPASRPLPPDAIAAVQTYAMQVTVDLVFYGVQTALFIAAMAALARQPPRPLLLFPLLILFLTSTMGAAAILLFYTIQVPEFGAAPPDIAREIFQLSVVLAVTDRVNYLISDLIVVWRAWVLWPDNLPVRAALALVTCGSTVGLIVEVVWAFHDYGTLEPATHSLLMMVPLLATNVLCTVLMAARCWSYRRNIKRSLGSSSRTRIERILLILVESGFVYCGLWLMFLILRQTSKTNATAYGVVKTAFHSLAGIYPTFIVLAVAGQRAGADSTLFTSAPPSHAIGFADGGEREGGSDVTRQGTTEGWETGASEVGPGTGGRYYGGADTWRSAGDTWASAGETWASSASGDGSTQVASETIKLERRKRPGKEGSALGACGSTLEVGNSTFGAGGSTSGASTFDGERPIPSVRETAYTSSSYDTGRRNRHIEYEDG